MNDTREGVAGGADAALFEGRIPAHFVDGLLEHVNVGVAFVDCGFRFLRVNPVLATLHGLPAAEHTAKHVQDVVPRLWPALEPVYRRALAGETISNEDIVGVTSGGRALRWVVNCYPARVEGRVVGIGVIVDDVTQRRLVEKASKTASATARATATRLAAIVESSDDAIIGKDLDGIVTNWNRGAEDMFGFTAKEMIGTSILRIIPPDRHDEETHILRRIKSGQGLTNLETLRRTKDGRAIQVSLTASPIRNTAGQVIGASKIARDITLGKAREREIERISHLYAARSQISQAIVCTPTRDDLFRKICEAIVTCDQVRMAWVGWRSPAATVLAPVAECGDKSGFLHQAKVHVGDHPQRWGPAGTAFREDRPHICNDLLAEGDGELSPADAELLDYRAVAAFPVREGGKVQGTLTVYSAESGFFRDREIALLVEATNDISFALDNMAREGARQYAEHTLRRERDFSEAVINSLPGVLYLYDAQGKFLRWNQSFERVTGYSALQIASMHPLDFFAKPDVERVAARIRDVFVRGDTDVEAGLLSQDGRVTPYYFTGNVAEIDGNTCLVGVGINISERKRAEEALSASEASYRALFERAPDGILIASSDSSYLDANTSICEMLGYTRAELIRLHASDIVVARQREQIGPTLEQVRAGRDSHREWRLRRKDGSVFPAEVVETVMPDGNLLAMIRDITERTTAEAKLREAYATLEAKVTLRTDELRSALVRAEAADRLKSAFLATMSHELRTPLNSIIGFTGIVLKGLAGPLTPEQSKQLGMVRGSARHLLALINDVLDLSRIEADQLEVRAERFHVQASVDSVLASVKPLADGKRLVLKAVLGEGLGDMVSDRRRVEQILLNLVNNALKFTSVGGVTLTVDRVAAVMGSQAEEAVAAVRFCISDTGIGVRAEDLATLFRPFRQIDTGLARQHEGSGLGLAICHRLTALLGGVISAASEWSKGSQFTFTLPVERAAS